MTDIRTLCEALIDQMKTEEIAATETTVNTARNDGDTDTMSKYVFKPTMKNTCADPTCASYGRPLVDRGYGYPVCDTAPWNHNVNGIGYDVPMKARYLTRK